MLPLATQQKREDYTIRNGGHREMSAVVFFRLVSVLVAFVLEECARGRTGDGVSAQHVTRDGTGRCTGQLAVVLRGGDGISGRRRGGRRRDGGRDARGRDIATGGVRCTIVAPTTTGARHGATDAEGQRGEQMPALAHGILR